MCGVTGADCFFLGAMGFGAIVFRGGKIKKRPTGCLNSPNDGEKEQAMKTAKNARKNLSLENYRIIYLD